MVDGGETYRVVLPDAIYYGASYYQVHEMDPSPSDTVLDWRGLVEAYLRGLNSSRGRPLDQLLSEE